MIKRQGIHKCDFLNAQPCSNCLTKHPDGYNFCYIQPLKAEDLRSEKKKKNYFRYVFYDTETTQNNEIIINGKKVKEHVANMLVAHVICQFCIDEKIDFNTNNIANNCFCGVFYKKTPKVFKNWQPFLNVKRILRFAAFSPINSNEDKSWDKFNPVDQFLNFLLNYGQKNITTIVIAHNGGRFDHHLILQKLYQQNIKVNTVCSGNKIYSFEIVGQHLRNIIFKDSNHFFQCPLAALVKTFGLKNEVEEKPYFPHYYNKMENLDKFLNHLPPLKYYGLDNFKVKNNIKFKSLGSGKRKISKMVR